MYLSIPPLKMKLLRTFLGLICAVVWMGRGGMSQVHLDGELQGTLSSMRMHTLIMIASQHLENCQTPPSFRKLVNNQDSSAFKNCSFQDSSLIAACSYLNGGLLENVKVPFSRG